MVNPFLLVFEVLFNKRVEKITLFAQVTFCPLGFCKAFLGQDVKKFFILTQFCT